MQVVRLALEAIDHAMTVRPCGMIVHDDPRALHANGSLRHDDMARVGRGLVFVAYRKVVSPNVHRLPRILVKKVLWSCAHESREKSPRAAAKDIARTRRVIVSVHLNVQSTLRLSTDCGAILIATRIVAFGACWLAPTTGRVSAATRSDT